MKELSVFIDESGDFGEYSSHSPYYIITMIFHNQEDSIEEAVHQLDDAFRNMNLENHCVHVGPLIRREEDYKYNSGCYPITDLFWIYRQEVSETGGWKY